MQGVQCYIRNAYIEMPVYPSTGHGTPRLPCLQHSLSTGGERLAHTVEKYVSKNVIFSQEYVTSLFMCMICSL